MTGPPPPIKADQSPPNQTLDRFLDAQDKDFAAVCAELAAGQKRTHWMWFIFPQLRALGRSGTARHFGLEDLAEAVAYWRHPTLGERLRHCTALVLDIQGRTAHEIFGSPDDLKLRSSMTLFEIAAAQEPAFGRVLDRYYGGGRDALTLNLVGAAP